MMVRFVRLFSAACLGAVAIGTIVGVREPIEQLSDEEPAFPPSSPFSTSPLIFTVDPATTSIRDYIELVEARHNGMSALTDTEAHKGEAHGANFPPREAVRFTRAGLLPPLQQVACP